MGHRARSHDRSRHRRLVQQPRDRDVGRLVLELVTQRLVPLDSLSVLLDARCSPPTLRPAEVLLAQDAAEQTSVHRRPRQDADAVVDRGGKYLELDRALHQVVERLLTREAGEVTAVGSFLGLHEMPAREVRRPDVEDLPLLDERLHRLPDLVPRRLSVDVVHLVQVDVIRLEATQRCFAREADVARREERVVRPVRHAAVQLRCDDRLLAAAAALGEPPADDLLRPALTVAESIDVGGVEEVDAFVDGAIHDQVGVGFVGLRAEVHRAEADAAHRQAGATEMRVLHGGNLLR